MLSVLLFVGGLVSVLVVGIPAVNLLARPELFRSWLRTGPRAALSVRAPVPVHPFTPLDLGPDPMVWPSERPWPAPLIAEPQWPSKLWDDEHFGAFWRNREGTATKPPAGRRRHNPTEVVPAAAAEDAWFDAEETAPKAPKISKVSVSSTAATPVPVAKRVPAPAKAPRPTGEKPKAPRSPAPAPAGPPAKAELEALIAKVGVAGAVKVVMERTGWDFRTAAQYLAKTR